jgi:hypothetical protein
MKIVGWYAQLYLMVCAVICCDVVCEVIFKALTGLISIGLDVVKRADRSFLSICGNNDFIVIAIEVEQVAITQGSDLNLTNSSWVII